MGCEEYKDDLTALLYDEASEVEARRIQGHLERCAECRGELESLRDVRQALGAWQVPSFADGRAPWVPPSFFWASAAAALLVIGVGVGVGLAGLEVRVGSEPLVVSIGRPVVGSAPVQQATNTSPAPAEPVPVALPEPNDDGAVDACVQRAQALLAESEVRQAAAVRASMSDLERRLLAQRQYDLARISAGFSYLEGKTGQSMARTTELMGQILRVSEGGE